MDEFIALFLLSIFIIFTIYLIFNIKDYKQILMIIFTVSLALHFNIFLY